MRIFIISILVALTYQANAQHMETLEKITWHGQAAVQIDNNGQLIVIDPFHFNSDILADVILITHSHGDHFSLDDIDGIATEQTQFVCPHDCKDQLAGAGYKNIRTVAPGDKINIGGTEILAVPMYNIVKSNFHPKEKRWTGYIIDVGGTRVYHAGDTERTPEMKEVECDIVMIPLGQTYTMNSVEEASEAALDTRAEIAIPIHYGLYEGTPEDAARFKELLEGKMTVVIMEQKK